MSWRWNLFDETRHMETHLDERIEGLRARGQSLRYQAYAAGLLLFLLLLAWGWERVEPMRILAPGLWGVILLSTLVDQLWQLWHGLLRVPQRKLASISRLGANLTIAGELAFWGVFVGLEAYALGWSLRDGLAAALLVMLAVYLLMDCAHNHALRVQGEAPPASRVAQFTALAGLLAALAAGVGLLLGPNFGQPGVHITDARIKFLSVALEQEPTSAVYTVEDWANGGEPALIQFYSYLWEGDGLQIYYDANLPEGSQVTKAALRRDFYGESPQDYLYQEGEWQEAVNAGVYLHPAVLFLPGEISRFNWSELPDGRWYYEIYYGGRALKRPGVGETAEEICCKYLLNPASGYLEEYRDEELRDRLPQRTVTWRMVVVDDLACGEAFQRQLAHPTAAGWQG